MFRLIPPKLAFAIMAVFSSAGISCIDMAVPDDSSELLIDTTGKLASSTSASNLITTAILKEQQVDIVLYPSSSLQDDEYALLDLSMQEDEIISRVLPLYKDGAPNRFEIGTMRGADIRKFLLNRALEKGHHDIHVAGLTYSVHIVGGLPQIYQISLKNGQPLEPKTYYRVAVNSKELDGKFPGYRYRHGFNFSFKKEEKSFDALKTLVSYLKGINALGNYKQIRSTVSVGISGTIEKPLSIASIQGVAHISPYRGYKVTTQGVVTAFGANEFGGYDFFIQSEKPDEDPRTSEALLVHVQKSPADLKPGCFVRLTGVVHEDLTTTQMTRTALRQVSEVDVRDCQKTLPEPVTIGGINPSHTVPNTKISTHFGNLNQKASLNLDDGIDFWESLEGMRMRVVRPRVTGLGGGSKDIRARKAYLNLFVVGENTATSSQVSAAGGLIIDPIADDYNPEIIKIIDHQYSDTVQPSHTFSIGDTFDYDLEGVFGYDVNLFGGGEYVLYVTGKFGSLSPIKPFNERPKTSLTVQDRKLTVSSFNVENLAADEPMRVKDVAEAIVTNLSCPDIVTLAEIQDYNGISFSGSASAKETVETIIANIVGCPHDAEYKSINIDPIQNQEGGEPGGNIRVAMIYNALRVNFEQRLEADRLSETLLTKDGHLQQNPGRVYPNDERFKGTRKSLIAEFEFNGEPVFVIGNHFNSKGGDTSMWSASQPSIRHSEVRRSRLAEAIHDYCEQILNLRPNANIVVLGDFNDFYESLAMKTLEGRSLYNLIKQNDDSGEPLVPWNDRYTYNYNGNSQTLDFIFTSENLVNSNPKFEIIHINTNFMGQVADHDPIIAQFDIGATD